MGAKLGQHFLQDTKIISRIVAALDPQKSETIIEIGPGHGELTFTLAEACAHRGASLLAIEKDPLLAEELKTKTDALRLSHTQIISGDIRTLLAPYAASLRSYALAGNIPYYLTGHLLRLIGSCIPLPRVTVLMMQQEVAMRAVARAPHMNKLSAALALWGNASLVARIPREAFVPPPRVTSAILMLTPRTDIAARTALHLAREDRAISVLFAHPRKTVGNNLRDAAKLSRTQPGSLTTEEASRLADYFLQEQFSLAHRPQELTVPLIERVALLL